MCLLPPLWAEERIGWDLWAHGVTGRHPTALVRHRLQAPEVRPVETRFRAGRTVRPKRKMQITVAGRVMLRQQLPIARGMLFVTLEVETAFVQCISSPKVQARREAALITRGRLEIVGNWRRLYVQDVWLLAPLGPPKVKKSLCSAAGKGILLPPGAGPGSAVYGSAVYLDACCKGISWNALPAILRSLHAPACFPYAPCQAARTLIPLMRERGAPPAKPPCAS